MDIFDETTLALKNTWDDDIKRQQAKIVIITAIGNATELSVKEAQLVLDELDTMLLSEKEEKSNRIDPSL